MRYGSNDPHISKNGVLKNKLGANTTEELEDRERDITAFRIAQLKISPIYGNFDLAHLQKIHHFIFSPVYEWAGEIRYGSLSKGSTVFTYPERIIPELNKLFNQLKAENYLQGLNLEQVTQRLAFYLGELNVHHPFREGDASVLVFRKADYRLLEELISRSITYSHNQEHK